MVKFKIEYPIPASHATLDGKTSIEVAAGMELWADTKDDAVTIFSTLFASFSPFSFGKVTSIQVDELPVQG